MSEYWKSTPKYFCKHCKTYVRDTKFERTQHEATAKHQGNLKRFLRELHRDHGRDERESQKAKNEVERLNKVVSASSGKPQSGLSPTERTPTVSTTSARQVASVSERKKQLAQLADMGIAIPEEYRGEMAMAGEWKVVSEREISGTKEERSQSTDASLSMGVRKRKHGEEEEEAGAGGIAARKGWGSGTRSYPEGAEDNDLDDLLANTKVGKLTKQPKLSAEAETFSSTDVSKSETGRDTLLNTQDDQLPIKKEQPLEDVHHTSIRDHGDEANTTPTVTFKKRKSKMSKFK